MNVLADDAVLEGVASPWLRAGAMPAAGMPGAAAAPMTGGQRARYAIVGAGFAGLSLAYHLALHGRADEIVVVDAGPPGAGASGRNSGMIGPGVWGPYQRMVDRFGAERARAMFAFTTGAVGLAVDLVQREKFDCDLAVGAQYRAALTQRQARALDTEAAALRAAGFDVPFLCAADMRKVVRADAYLAAMQYRHTATLHPLKLVAALCAHLRRKGVRIYHGTPVTRIAGGGQVVLETGGGDITADHVVLATNGFASLLGTLKQQVVPLMTQMAMTAPLSALQLQQIGLGRQAAIIDSRKLFSFYRLTADHRLVFGGGRAEYLAFKDGIGQAFRNPVDRTAAAALRQELLSTFSGTQGLEIDLVWRGTMGFTIDNLPVVGRVGAPNIWFCGAWCGHGLALSFASGARLADELARAPCAAAPAPGVFPWERGGCFKLPPPTILAPALRLYVGAMAAGDRLGLAWQARKLRRAPGCARLANGNLQRNASMNHDTCESTEARPVRWPTPTLRATSAACLNDARPYLGRCRQWRMRVFLALLAVTTRAQQRTLSMAGAQDAAAARAEGVARLYLGCRESLAYFNHFPVGLATDTRVHRSAAERAASLACSASRLALGGSRFGVLLGSTRLPGRHCDAIAVTERAAHWVILRQGLLFKVALHRNMRQRPLAVLIEELLRHSSPAVSTGEGTPALRLGHLSAQRRTVWRRRRAALLAVQDSGAALAALQEAAFLMCLDDEVRPAGIGAMARALRIDNPANRFYDKCLQIIVFGNGEAGLLCDHGAMDGSDAVLLAEALAGGEQSSRPDPVPGAQDGAGQEPLSLQPMPYRIADDRGQDAAALACLDKMRRGRACLAARWDEFDGEYFRSRRWNADSLIQIAIQLAWFRCFGRMPSAFEPVGMAHLDGGRLDFISPVSEESQALIGAIASGSPPAQLDTLLARAVSRHRHDIRLAKQGGGHIGHLLALSALECPHDHQRGVWIQHCREALMSRLDTGMALLIRRDLMASNGGASAALGLFGTILHKDNMIGIGYMASAQGLTLDIQANGRYAHAAGQFRQQLYRALGEIGAIGEIGVPEAIAEVQ